MIKTTDINLEVNTGSTIYVTVDVFRFIKDEELPCIEIQMENNGEYEHLEEVEEENELIINHEDLKRFALNWIFKNVEIVKELELGQA